MHILFTALQQYRFIKFCSGIFHPLTDTGLEYLVRIIAENVRRGVQSDSIQFMDHGSETVYGSTTRKFEGILPKDRRKSYYCYRAVINVDIRKKVPVKIMIYDWDDNLIENTDMKI